MIGVPQVGYGRPQSSAQIESNLHLRNELGKQIVLSETKLVLRTHAKLQGALGRIDNAIAYQGLNDVFEIAAKYATAIAVAHAFPDANKRTALAVCLEYLSLNDFELTSDNDLLADAIRTGVEWF